MQPTYDIYTDAGWNHAQQKKYFKYGVLLCRDEEEFPFYNNYVIEAFKTTWVTDAKFNIHMAEIFAIIFGLKQLKAQTPGVVNFYSDNLFAFNLLNHLKPKEEIQTCYQHLYDTYKRLKAEYKKKGFEINVNWIPGHENVWGNEQVNYLCSKEHYKKVAHEQSRLDQEKAKAQETPAQTAAREARLAAKKEKNRAWVAKHKAQKKQGVTL